MTQRYSDEIERIIDVFLEEKAFIFSAEWQIEAILEMHDKHGLCDVMVGTGRYMISDRSRFGSLTLAVHPRDSLFEYRGVTPLRRHGALIGDV